MSCKNIEIYWVEKIKNHCCRKEKQVHEVSRYFYWIRATKEQIQKVKDDPTVSDSVKPGGDYYPSYNRQFQSKLVQAMLDFYSKEVIVNFTNEEWYDWLVLSKDSEDVILIFLRNFPNSIRFVTTAWENIAKSSALQLK